MKKKWILNNKIPVSPWFFTLMPFILDFEENFVKIDLSKNNLEYKIENNLLFINNKACYEIEFNNSELFLISKFNDNRSRYIQVNEGKFKKIDLSVLNNLLKSKLWIFDNMLLEFNYNTLSLVDDKNNFIKGGIYESMFYHGNLILILTFDDAFEKSIYFIDFFDEKRIYIKKLLETDLYDTDILLAIDNIPKASI